MLATIRDEKWNMLNMQHIVPKSKRLDYPDTPSGALLWRHNERDGVSNHQRLNCLLNRLFRHKSKKTSQLRVTSLCEGNPPVAGGSPHNGPVTRKMFPFGDVFMDLEKIRVPTHMVEGGHVPGKIPQLPHIKAFISFISVNIGWCSGVWHRAISLRWKFHHFHQD